MFKRFFFLALIATLATGLAQAQAQSVNWDDTNKLIIQQHIIPAYQALADTSHKLELTSKNYCQSPGSKNLAELKQAFHHAMDSWNAIQHIRLGRIELFMRFHRYQLWPDKRNTTGKHLARLLDEKDRQVLEEDNFRRTSVAVQGFSALERLLFADNNRYLSGKQAGYACKVVMAITRNLSEMSKELAEEWQSEQTTPFQKLFVTDERALQDIKTDSDNTSRDAAARFLSLLQTQLEVVMDVKLARPMDKSASKAKPRRSESWRSERSLKNIVINLQAVEDFYLKGFSAQLKKTSGGAELDKQLRQQFRSVIQQAKSFKQPLAKLVRNKQQWAKLQQLATNIRKLKGLLTSQVNKTLDLPQLFNALDGD